MATDLNYPLNNPAKITKKSLTNHCKIIIKYCNSIALMQILLCRMICKELKGSNNIIMFIYTFLKN